MSSNKQTSIDILNRNRPTAHTYGYGTLAAAAGRSALVFFFCFKRTLEHRGLL